MNDFDELEWFLKCVKVHIYSNIQEHSWTRYLTVQLEKATFFQHLSGLGASMGQIDESKSVFRSQNSLLVADAISLNVEKYV